jgi:hypothetical protein
MADEDPLSPSLGSLSAEQMTHNETGSAVPQTPSWTQRIGNYFSNLGQSYSNPPSLGDIATEFQSHANDPTPSLQPLMHGGWKNLPGAQMATGFGVDAPNMGGGMAGGLKTAVGAGLGLGLKGAKGSTMEEIVNLGNASGIEQMGATPSEIMQETGWMRQEGVGKWLSEYPDVAAQFTPNMIQHMNEIKPGGSLHGIVRDFFSHPEAEDRYPHLGSTPMMYHYPMRSNYEFLPQGEFGDASHLRNAQGIIQAAGPPWELGAYLKHIEPGRANKWSTDRTGLPPDFFTDPRSNMLHEVYAHGAQRAENFPRSTEDTQGDVVDKWDRYMRRPSEMSARAVQTGKDLTREQMMSAKHNLLQRYNQQYIQQPHPAGGPITPQMAMGSQVAPHDVPGWPHPDWMSMSHSEKQNIARDYMKSIGSDPERFAKRQKPTGKITEIRSMTRAPMTHAQQMEDLEKKIRAIFGKDKYR